MEATLESAIISCLQGGDRNQLQEKHSKEYNVCLVLGLLPSYLSSCVCVCVCVWVCVLFNEHILLLYVHQDLKIKKNEIRIIKEWLHTYVKTGVGADDECSVIHLGFSVKWTWIGILTPSWRTWARPFPQASLYSSKQQAKKQTTKLIYESRYSTCKGFNRAPGMCWVLNYWSEGSVYWVYTEQQMGYELASLPQQGKDRTQGLQNSVSGAWNWQECAPNLLVKWGH